VRVAQGLQAKEILVEEAEETQQGTGQTAGAAVEVELEAQGRKATLLWVTAV